MKMFPQITCSCLLVIAICIVCSLVSTSAEVDDDEAPVVKSARATFRGKRIEVNPRQLPDFHGSVAAYTRIPYAEPPVDELRFKRPVPKVVEGDFDASKDSLACPQVSMPTMDFGLTTSEDCLFLDVFVPEPKPTSAAVMVWIHGGGFQTGAGSVPRHLPIPLAAMNDVIVVTFNYRINVFGFLASGDDEIPANLGLLDQHQVFVWVQENIEVFGGDPSRVTIFGQSAGSGCVNFHVISPMNAGLFSGAIMQSGAVNEWAYSTQEDAAKMTFAFGTAMNCSGTETKELVTCLREKSADDIINVFMENPMLAQTITPRPTIDGQFFPKDPVEMTAEGTVNRVDIMIGCLKDEGNLFLLPASLGMEGTDRPMLNKTVFQGLLSMHVNYFRAGGVAIDQLALDTTTIMYASAEQLADPDADYADAFKRFSTDAYFICSTFFNAEQLAAAGNPVYTFLMTHAPSVSIWGKDFKWMGATHGEDIPYVFGNPLIDVVHDDDDWFLRGSFNDDEVEMSMQMMKYWSNFAKTGNPNLLSKDNPENSKYSSWPRYSKGDPNYKELSRTFGNLYGHPSPKQCHFQKYLLPQLLDNADEMARLKSLLEEKVNADSEKTCEDPESCPKE